MYVRGLCVFLFENHVLLAATADELEVSNPPWSVPSVTYLLKMEIKGSWQLVRIYHFLSSGSEGGDDATAVVWSSVSTNKNGGFPLLVEYLFSLLNNAC